jgi:hypothetical protein
MGQKRPKRPWLRPRKVPPSKGASLCQKATFPRRLAQKTFPEPPCRFGTGRHDRATGHGLLAVGGPILGWTYQTGSKRLGIVDLFACEIVTLCRVGAIVDFVPRLITAVDGLTRFGTPTMSGYGRSRLRRIATAQVRSAVVDGAGACILAALSSHHSSASVATVAGPSVSSASI